MKPKHLIAAMLLAACAIGPAAAACPPPVAGDTAEVLEANQQRLACQQRELTQKAEQYQLKVQINTMQQSIQDIQLQQRMDSLNFPKPVTPGF